jgi:predicted ArsR family transcriptional regulator
MSGWSARFFTTTRGRIVMLLRRAGRTVDELAQVLDLTDNGVRSHLATLERDGLVRQHGTRRGGGKPAYTYELTQEADTFFPKAYDEILVHLLDLLADRLPRAQLSQVIGDLSHRLSVGRVAPPGDLRSRVAWGAGVLRDMGGLPEVEEYAGAFLIRGYSCPIGAVASKHPDACRLAEMLLSRVIGATVRERCERDGSPRCCFEVLPGPNGDKRASGGGAEQQSTEPHGARGYDEPMGGDPPCWQHLFEEDDDAARPTPERP